MQALTKAPPALLTNLRIGEQLPEFEPREVRRFLIGRHEMRYEIQASTLYVCCGAGIPGRSVETGERHASLRP